MRRFPLLALLACLALPGALAAQDEPMSEARARALGAKYVGWFFEGQSDSLYAAMTPEFRGLLGDLEALDAISMQIASEVGVESELISESAAIASDGLWNYYRVARFDLTPATPLQWTFTFTPEGKISLLSLNPPSAE